MFEALQKILWNFYIVQAKVEQIFQQIYWQLLQNRENVMIFSRKDPKVCIEYKKIKNVIFFLCKYGMNSINFAVGMLETFVGLNFWFVCELFSMLTFSVIIVLVLLLSLKYAIFMGTTNIRNHKKFVFC